MWKSSLQQTTNANLRAMVYLIKLTQQKSRLPYILTRKCFTIAIKTIQLSSHITHDEFINATIFQRNAF